MSTYNICMFANNEEANIRTSIESVLEQVSDNLHAFYLIANGCSDRTVTVAHAVRANGFDKLIIIELNLGDKCNAWNHYMHEVDDEVDIHFFVDADVSFSVGCFDKLAQRLGEAPEETVAIAGLPLTGRNRDYYESLVKERSCFFGNLYGLKKSFIQRVKTFPFYLPIGLNWIDSFLTKAVNTDLAFGPDNLPQRVIYIEGVGYQFDKLSYFSWGDIQLYFNRIARYELGKIQETYLDRIPAREWPAEMVDINRDIDKNFSQTSSTLSFFKKWLVLKRLKKLLKNV